MPRDAFDSRLRRRVLAELEAATHGTLAEETADLAEVQLSEAPLVRLRFVLMVDPEAEPARFSNASPIFRPARVWAARRV